MNIYVVVRGENHEGYEIVQAFEKEDDAIEFAEQFTMENNISGCDYVAIVELVNGKPI